MATDFGSLIESVRTERALSKPSNHQTLTFAPGDYGYFRNHDGAILVARYVGSKGKQPGKIFLFETDDWWYLIYDVKDAIAHFSKSYDEMRELAMTEHHHAMTSSMNAISKVLKSEPPELPASQVPLTKQAREVKI